MQKVSIFFNLIHFFFFFWGGGVVEPFLIDDLGVLPEP